MTVEVVWLSTSHSLKVTSCRTVTSDQNDERGGGGGVGVKGGGGGGGVNEGGGGGGVGVKEGGGGEGRGVNDDRGGGGGGGVKEGGGGGGGGVKEGGGGGSGEIVTVLFSTRCTKFLDLKIGQTIRIHPPWYVDFLLKFLIFFCLESTKFLEVPYICMHRSSVQFLNTSRHVLAPMTIFTTKKYRTINNIGSLHMIVDAHS